VSGEAVVPSERFPETAEYDYDYEDEYEKGKSQGSVIFFLEIGEWPPHVLIKRLFRHFLIRRQCDGRRKW
jgi:hypothetical protein